MWNRIYVVIWLVLVGPENHAYQHIFYYLCVFRSQTNAVRYSSFFHVNFECYLHFTKHTWITIYDYTTCCHAFSCTAMYLAVLTVLIENRGHAKCVLTGTLTRQPKYFSGFIVTIISSYGTENEFSIFWERLSMSFSQILLWRKHVFKKHDIIHWGVFLSQEPLAPGGDTLGIFGWGCAAGTMEPLTYTRASSAKFCYPILE